MISRGQKILKLLMDKDKYTTPAFSAATVSGCDNNELNIGKLERNYCDFLFYYYKIF